MIEIGVIFGRSLFLSVVVSDADTKVLFLLMAALGFGIAIFV
tara:strand:- start:664 stop:789 length:126 start_codon:yes stop_codon:yes gene_type:complete